MGLKGAVRISTRGSKVINLISEVGDVRVFLQELKNKMLEIKKSIMKMEYLDLVGSLEFELMLNRVEEFVELWNTHIE